MNNSSKSNTLFFVICIILIVIFLVLFLYVRGINQNLKLKYEKNVFFVELDKKPYQPFNAFDEDSTVCIKGDDSVSRDIPYEDLKIQPNDPKFLLMFWIKLDSNFIRTDQERQEPKYYLDNTESNDNNILVFDNQRYQIKLSTINARITFIMNERKSILSNVPYDKWFCLATLYTNDYTEIYLNGRLAETIQYTNQSGSDFNKILNNSKLTVGEYPGYLAYLVVSVNEKYFNSYSIYQEYLYYKNKILNSEKYHSNSDFNFKLNLGLLDNNTPDLYKNEKTNTCYDDN